MSDAFEPVLRTRDPVEAEMAEDLLERNGLHPRVAGRCNAALLGAAQFAFETRIEVPAEEVERANELLETLFEEAEDGAAEQAAAIAAEEAAQTRDGDGERGVGDAAVEPGAEPNLEKPPPAMQPRAGTAVPSEQPRSEERETDAGEIVSSTDPAWAPLLGLTALHFVLYWAAGGEGGPRLEEVGAQRGWPPPGELYRLVTSSFLHFDIFHLLSNTEGLLLYGWGAIQLFGLPRTAFVYMAAALVGGSSSAFAFGPNTLGAGASGCVFALIGLVLAGKLQEARRATVGRGRGLLRVSGWALFALPPALYFDYAAHLGGLAAGVVCGLLMAPWSAQAALRRARQARAFAMVAVLLFVAPWAQRLAASCYAPCATGSLERCRGWCDAGDGEACHRLGMLAWEEEGGDLKGRELLSRACDAGFLESCGTLGDRLSRGGVEAAEEGDRLLRRACQGGYRQACADLAKALFEVSRSRDGEAVGLLKEACEAGTATACSSLAWAYREARGVTRDTAEAARLLRKGCEGGDITGCRKLAAVLATGDGVPEDRGEAASLLAGACRQGEWEACDELEERPAPRIPAWPAAASAG